MSQRQSRYRRDELLALKPKTDVVPMLFRARYIHQDGRWVTFAQLEVLHPEGIGTIDCGHVNMTRSVVEVHQPLDKSAHHRMVCFVARVGTYLFHGDRRGNLMLERMPEVPSLWFENIGICDRAIGYIENIKGDEDKD